MRSQFLASEVAIGLRRNLTMTFALIITLGLSLAMFGSALLIRKQVDLMKDEWYDKVEVSMFLDKSVTQDQRLTLKESLEAHPEIQQVFYESSADALENAKEQFRDQPDLLASIGPDVLPESFRVKLKDPAKFEDVASEYRGAPGVFEVKDQREFFRPLFRILDVFRRAAFLGAGVALIAASLLIFNTVRVSAFTRRRETGIMRLVGASNLSIQLPFLVEGALAGVIGALFAAGLLAGGKTLFIDNLLSKVITFTPFVVWRDVWAVVGVVFPVGVGLAVLLSLLTLRKYLRV
ncbi:MAG TPA: permease-like cell division protein FtsX [Mycobacteriales bacterium]|nr:permease-like cell division protein FtsX [Mycobacteriales bacterium]